MLASGPADDEVAGRHADPATFLAVPHFGPVVRVEVRIATLVVAGEGDQFGGHCVGAVPRAIDLHLDWPLSGREDGHQAPVRSATSSAMAYAMSSMSSADAVTVCTATSSTPAASRRRWMKVISPSRRTVWSSGQSCWMFRLPTM